MTAEIVAMNRMGVAMAADSAVTIGAKKVYTSADKLFQLSFSAPVGIMVYGNASYQTLTWDAVIKTYRRNLKSKRFATIEEYASDFTAFLKDGTGFLRPEWRSGTTEYMLHLLFNDVRERLRVTIIEKLKSKQEANSDDGSLTVQELAEAFSVVAWMYLEQIKKAEYIEGADDNFVKTVKSGIAEIVSRVQAQIFEQAPIPVDGTELLLSIAAEHLSRFRFGGVSGLSCGIVIAGFGEEEYCPALAHYELEEAVLGTPRKGKTQFQDCSTVQAVVRPFAQKDPVYHFLQGVDEELDGFMRKTAKDMIDGSVQAILDKVAEKDHEFAKQISDAVKPTIDQNTMNLFSHWSNKQRNFWEPAMEIASILPKDELAAMAESLVNLTKFRRRMTPSMETVGGPIDVAIITKGDGFVWMRRKHYFDPTLNPRVMSRFERGE